MARVGQTAPGIKKRIISQGTPIVFPGPVLWEAAVMKVRYAFRLHSGITEKSDVTCRREDVAVIRFCFI
jgi:hypothetical protein